MYGAGPARRGRVNWDRLGRPIEEGGRLPSRPDQFDSLSKRLYYLVMEISLKIRFFQNQGNLSQTNSIHCITDFFIFWKKKVFSKFGYVIFQAVEIVNRFGLISFERKIWVSFYLTENRLKIVWKID